MPYCILSVSFSQIIFRHHFISSFVPNFREKKGEKEGGMKTQRGVGKAGTCLDTRKGLSSRQRCKGWGNFNLNLSSPCAKQGDLGKLLSLWPSYLGLRGNLRPGLLGRLQRLNLYMASVKELGRGLGA